MSILYRQLRAAFESTPNQEAKVAEILAPIYLSMVLADGKAQEVNRLKDEHYKFFSLVLNFNHCEALKRYKGNVDLLRQDFDKALSRLKDILDRVSNKKTAQDVRWELYNFLVRIAEVDGISEPSEAAVLEKFIWSLKMPAQAGSKFKPLSALLAVKNALEKYDIKGETKSDLKDEEEIADKCLIESEIKSTLISKKSEDRVDGSSDFWSSRPIIWAMQWDAQLQEETFASLEKVYKFYVSEAVCNGTSLSSLSSNGKLDLSKCAQNQSGISIDKGVCIVPPSWIEQADEIFFIADVHGDVETLRCIIERTDFFSADKLVKLVFLGDYGDRGSGTLAVWCVLFQLAATYPNRILLLRGNHDEYVDGYLSSCTGIIGAEFKDYRGSFAVPGHHFCLAHNALGLLVGGDLELVGKLLSVLPGLAIFPDGLLAVHGGPVPLVDKKYAENLDENVKEKLRLKDLNDLRRPEIQYWMRWVDLMDKEVVYSWHKFPGHGRLPASQEDVTEFFEKTGLNFVVHGHTHPSTGWERYEVYSGKVLGLNSNKITSPNAEPAIGRYVPNEELRVKEWLLESGECESHDGRNVSV